jgi:hypothetical protein
MVSANVRGSEPPSLLSWEALYNLKAPRSKTSDFEEGSTANMALLELKTSSGECR